MVSEWGEGRREEGKERAVTGRSAGGGLWISSKPAVLVVCIQKGGLPGVYVSCLKFWFPQPTSLG